MMLKSGRIRLVRPSAVITTHKMWVSGKTLENYIHQDRRRNVGCVHHIDNTKFSIHILISVKGVLFLCVKNREKRKIQQQFYYSKTLLSRSESLNP